MGWKSVFLVVQILYFWSVRSSAEVNKFLETSDCTCEGHNMTYQCTVIGDGATIWKGSAFRCPATNSEITLFHTDRMGENRMCNDGKILGRIVTAENNSYTSQLTVLVSPKMIGRTIGCFHDSVGGTVEVGSSNLTITADSYPPPEDIRLVNATSSQLTFWWSSVSDNCSAVHYNISAYNCGHCPTKSNKTTVTCTGWYIDGHLQVCKFSLQTVDLCNNKVGNESREVLVTLRVSDAPIVTVIPTYSYKTEKLLSINTMFSEVDSLNISDGVDGPALYYTINYTDSVSGVVCASPTILATDCVNGTCGYNLNVLSTHCNSSSYIKVTVSATNTLGNGLPSTPIFILGEINQFVKISVDIASSYIICLFYHQGNSTKECSFTFGLLVHSKANCYSKLLSSTNMSNTSTTERVYVGFSAISQTKLQEEYCFIVTANNGTFTVIIEGSFVAGVARLIEFCC